MILLNALAALVAGSQSFADQSKQILILSGGGSPASNHYSQYLQTKAVYEDLSTRFNYKTSLFFGAGYSPDSSAQYADVHKTETKDGKSLSRYIVGRIPNNSPATKENVLNYFKTINKQLDAFFIVVSDHGLPNEINGKTDSTFSNNCIDMWNAKLQNGVVEPIGSFEKSRCLSKNELKDLLSLNVQARKKVFVMSQCFSGGFHQMSVDESQAYPTADINTCGFTAVTQDTWASGCSPDVDGPTYQGYERSFTEQLTGIDYTKNLRIRNPKNSFRAAHEEALLEDFTLDIPLATSDYYLWRWALKITNSDFKPRTDYSNIENALKKFNQAAEYSFISSDVGFKSKQAIFQRMKAVLSNNFPELKLQLNLPYLQFKDLVEERKRSFDELSSKLEKAALLKEKLLNGAVKDHWLNHLNRGFRLNLTTQELSYEVALQKQPASPSRFIPFMSIQNPELSERFGIYLNQRESKIMEYATQSQQPYLISHVEKIKWASKFIESNGVQLEKIQKQHGLLRRLLIYRQILGAWAALSELKDEKALSEIKGLLECENTSL